jgi:hypothetical protein
LTKRSPGSTGWMRPLRNSSPSCGKSNDGPRNERARLGHRGSAQVCSRAAHRRARWRGARVIDAGVHVPGGFAAGRALAELCMGGLGHLEPRR